MACFKCNVPRPGSAGGGGFPSGKFGDARLGEPCLLLMLPAADAEGKLCWELPGILAAAGCSGQAQTWGIALPMAACMLGRRLLP